MPTIWMYSISVFGVKGIPKPPRARRCVPDDAMENSSSSFSDAGVELPCRLGKVELRANEISGSEGSLIWYRSLSSSSEPNPLLPWL